MLVLTSIVAVSITGRTARKTGSYSELNACTVSDTTAHQLLLKGWQLPIR